ncbi:MAG TPA: leucyl aminopeptidase family protein [Acetobacteraceae bacterium]|nr:leucyl aminopeptidase family protein [Acetobacteraceae bacterium]
MDERDLDCLAGDGAACLPLHAVRPAEEAALLARLPSGAAAFLRQTGWSAKSGALALLPGPDGLAGAVLGLGEETGPFVFGALPFGLPEGTNWRLEPGGYAPEEAVLGFCLGAYRYTALKAPARAPARLAMPDGCAPALAAARAAWLVRDLINAPANLLGPEELAEAARALAGRHGAECEIIAGEALESGYPAVAAVGRGSARAPRVAVLRWQGSAAGKEAPLISLCGKGVCFDTGGYDLKPSAAMLRMKKDMGGAAILLGVARMVMEADLPVRLVLRIGCVENSVSGTAMRPLDVLRTRRGLTVEVGNTDAEGRLVLCDLLAEASDEAPALLVDAATLTGAARVALGPDLPALFTPDDAVAELLLKSGTESHDPFWRLPLWKNYDSWLASGVADINNTGSKPLAGAITAALFLERFVVPRARWAHIDVYAWNDATSPGRPEGGEAQGMRAVFRAITRVAKGEMTAGTTG